MFKDYNDNASCQKQNLNLFNSFYPTMSIVLKICLYGTYSKMGQLQKQWIHILKMNKSNFKYKGCYQGRKTFAKDHRCVHKDQHLQPMKRRLETGELKYYHSFLYIQNRFIQEKRKQRKDKVHSRSRLKRFRHPTTQV